MMNRLTINNLAQWFLISTAAGVIIAGFAYGIMPEKNMQLIADVDSLSRDLKNVFRALMGIYLLVAGFWLWAANKPQYHRVAIINCLLFIGGAGLGRILSLLFDGVPSPAFIGFLGIEVSVAVAGLVLLRLLPPTVPAQYSNAKDRHE